MGYERLCGAHRCKGNFLIDLKIKRNFIKHGFETFGNEYPKGIIEELFKRNMGGLFDA